jgi:hypothetical protein
VQINGFYGFSWAFLAWIFEISEKIGKLYIFFVDIFGDVRDKDSKNIDIVLPRIKPRGFIYFLVLRRGFIRGGSIQGRL